MKKLLSVTASPHLRTKTVTQTIMLDVLIALCPALIAATVLFGVRALVVGGVCVAASVLSEYIYRRLMHLPATVQDLSAAVTGLLLAFNLPVTIPLWMAAIGSFVAVVIVKQLFGGIGKNFANPAIVGRIVLFIGFATPMSRWVPPFAVDAVSSPTPLALLYNPDAVRPGYLQLFLGNIPGSLGETCTLALLLGGIYLVVRKVITLSAPLSFLGTVLVVATVMGQDGIYHLLAGGAVLGAIFMATDYTTTPTTERGKVLFGVGCGIITMVIRQFSSYPEGVSFAILIMNIVTPHIDQLTAKKAFGEAKRA